jgi:hypothetical protein
MAEVVESEILDAKELAGTREGGADALGIVWKDAPCHLGLALGGGPVMGTFKVHEVKARLSG